jgi:unsaturated rhamnogalacturonyl hydrolase
MTAAKSVLEAAMKIALVACLAMVAITSSCGDALAQSAGNERVAVDGDAPADPGPLATLSPDMKPEAIQSAMRKVADWQSARVADTPSQDWTYATLYAGLLSASKTLQEPRYRDLVLHVAEHYQWTLGPRKTHADDQAIGQSYLWLYGQSPAPERIQPLKAQFDSIMQLPDDPAKPVWWWCDALFMAPPVWSGLASVTHDTKYVDYMNHEWKVTSKLLWDPQERLFFRDKNYFNKREKNGRKVFWSRGNGWVMGGLVRVLETLPANSRDRGFYLEKFKQMSASVATLQGPDGLWRAGLLDAGDYRYPEVSGSAFFVYAMAWGINHHVLDAKRYRPVVERGWAGLVQHIYADGRLGSIQPVGEAPGAYTESSSYVFGVGAFLLAGSEVNQLSHKSAGTRGSPIHH